MALNSAIPTEVVDAALANPEIRKQGERVIAALFKEIDYVLEYGDDNERRRLMNTVMPSLLRGVQSAKQDEEREAQRREYQELRQMLMGLGAKPPE